MATAVAIVVGSTLRHVLQIIVSMGHLYGVALYYGTCTFEHYLRGNSYSRPEFLYYWVYYVGFNMPWVVVPACELLRLSHRRKNAPMLLITQAGLIYQSAQNIRKVFGAIQWIADKTAEVQKALKLLDERNEDQDEEIDMEDKKTR